MSEKERIVQGKKKEVSLLGIFGKETLNELIRKLADATDFSFSIIDYRGQQIADEVIANPYCLAKKDTPECLECQMQAAFAAAKAAIKCCPYRYRCPQGLSGIAVPVIVKDQYLGALIGGKVRCADEKKNSASLFLEEDEIVEPKKDPLYEEVPEFSDRRMSAVADLMYLLLKEMGEKETYGLKLSTLERRDVHLQDMRRKNALMVSEVREKEMAHLRAKLMPQLLLNMFSTVSNLAILESADKTEAAIADLSSVLRYYIDDSQEKTTVKKELEQIEHYLKVLRQQYGDRFSYRIKCDETTGRVSIPVLTIFPFVGYVLDFGVIPGYFQGTVYIDVEVSGNHLVISTQLEKKNPDVSGKKTSRKSDLLVDDGGVLEQLENTKKRLRYFYGDDCKITIRPQHTVIELPKMMNRSEVKNG